MKFIFEYRFRGFFQVYGYIKGGMMGTEGNILQEQLNVGESFLIPIGTSVELELDGVMARIEEFLCGRFTRRLPDLKIPKHHNRSWP